METIQKFIRERRVEGALLRRLERLSSEDSVSVCRLLEALNPSANTLREILLIADEICAAEMRTLEQLLKEDRIHELLMDSALPMKVRQSKLRSALEELRYPLLSGLRREVARCVEELVGRYGVRIRVPEDFEGDTVRVDLACRSPAELREQAKKLHELSEDSSLLRVFAILRGEV